MKTQLIAVALLCLTIGHEPISLHDKLGVLETRLTLTLKQTKE